MTVKEAIDVMDRKTVMLWLEICGKNDDCSAVCPYRHIGPDCMCRLMADALEHMKEQENASKRNPVIICPHCEKRVK